MADTSFERLQAYHLAERLADDIWGMVIGRLKPIINELAPKLNAHLKSIGNVPEKRMTNDE